MRPAEPAMGTEAAKPASAPHPPGAGAERPQALAPPSEAMGQAAPLSPGLAALAAHPGPWADKTISPAALALLHEQAEQMGVDPQALPALLADLRTGRQRLADVLGFTPGQLAAMAFRASELLREGLPRRALTLYLGLYELDPGNFRYQRGAALSFQYLKQYGFALGYYRLALATLGKPDVLCLAYLAECVAALRPKEEALAAFDAALALTPIDVDEQRALVRARTLRARLLLAAP